MSRWKKRDKPQPHYSSPLPKRSRPSYNAPEMVAAAVEEDKPPKQTSLIIVTGLLPSCTVFEFKSRFEMFGCISRLRIDRSLGRGYVTYRSKDSAEAAIAASLDPSSGITIGSQKVEVAWANDPLPQWRVGVGATLDKDHSRPSSKLLRAEIPLSRHGRGNKKLGADTSLTPTKSEPELPFKGREIIAYDDLL